MKKTSMLASLYNEKSAIIARVGCISELGIIFASYAALTQKAKGSKDIIVIEDSAKSLEKANSNVANKCELF
jgi:hypothetical protein